MPYPPVCNFLNGEAADSGKLPQLDVLSPLTGETISQVPLSGENELQSAVNAGRAAFGDWAGQTIKQRVQPLFNYRELLRRHAEELARLAHEENGKTLEEGRAEVAKAIEVTEFACSLPQLAAGEVLEVSPGVECRVTHRPLGVVASITPFNFPTMVPHWTIPIAVGLGNCLILKPSEQTPLSAARAGELMREAGIPPGVFQVLHGDRQLVEAICDHPDIAALTFVGSTPVARRVYARATSHCKRVLSLGGAKNHLIVLPDAAVEMTADNVVESMAGCAGQRCMAAASMVAVGAVDPIVDAICERARGMQPGVHLGAVISAAARERIEGHITAAEQAGARVLVDGRGATAAGCEGGFYVGPTVIDNVTPDMAIAREEVFGPVLAILRASDLNEALEIENRSPYGNAAAVYTRDGASAAPIVEGASAGMIGVNIGVPVPREPFGFGGWNDSRFGSGDITGKSAIQFWTQSKKVTSRWP